MPYNKFMFGIENAQMTVEEAARKYGYRSKEGFKRRLRTLRQRGHVVDLGNPPQQYLTKITASHAEQTAPAIVLRWINPKIYLVISVDDEILLQGSEAISDG